MTDKYKTNDLVTFALDQKPLEFSQALNDMILDRIHDRIQDKKLAIAQGMFSQPTGNTETEGDE